MPSFTRILGELKKLGIRSISRNSVKRILKDAGYDPGPKRGEGTWDDFLKQHAASLWQCDFFSKRILTLKGIRDVFVLVFLNVKTRRVILSPATLHPNEAWVVAQAETFVKQARAMNLPVVMVQRDRDRKFTKSFDAKLKCLRVKMKPGAFRAPNTNAFVERFIQSIQQECLDQFVIFGERHMDHVCAEYLTHYHEERPHSADEINNELLTRTKKPVRPKTKQGNLNDEIIPLSELRCEQRLGGLLKSYIAGGRRKEQHAAYSNLTQSQLNRPPVFCAERVISRLRLLLSRTSSVCSSHLVITAANFSLVRSPSHLVLV